MRKIRLNLDNLELETFDAGRADALPGTVHGQEYSNLGTCGVAVATCQYKGTCQVTCWSGCGGGSQTSLCDE